MSRSEKKRQRILGFNLPILILSFLDSLSLSVSELQSENVMITLSLGYEIFDGLISQAEASVIQVWSLHSYSVSF